jgi:Zn-dependent protease
MVNSLLIGRIAGIRILIHWTFLLLLGFIVFTEMRKGSDAVAIIATIGFVLALFICILLHELGHSLTAKRFGIKTRKITLLPIGGLASLERIPEDPKQELWVSLAGPTVNVVIALLLYPFVSSFGSFLEPGIGDLASTKGFLYSLFRVNVTLVLFNVIPAFPMDGGRVLRALLALRLDRGQATRIAAGLGQLIAIGFIFFGLFNNPFLVLIGIFVYFGAKTENVVVQHIELLKDYTVRHAMMTNFVTLSANDTVKDAADKLLSGSDQDLIVVDNDQAIGVMTRYQIINSLKENRSPVSVLEVMDRNFDSVKINDSLTEVYTNAQRKPNAFYPVLENHQLRGVIDRNNLDEFIKIQAALHQH